QRTSLSWALGVGRWTLDVFRNRSAHFSIPNVLTTTAGLPATTVSGGTLLVTTDPAATTEFSPIVTPFRMTAFMPIQTLSAIFTGRVLSFGRGGRPLKKGASACASMRRCAGSNG